MLTQKHKEAYALVDELVATWKIRNRYNNDKSLNDAWEREEEKCYKLIDIIREKKKEIGETFTQDDIRRLYDAEIGRR